ncbi:PREDICTED: rhomboid-related protein 2 [Papilio xuthus]|uniref:Rhomboid-related protein 2 n=1 Tax=Papilio xuthus TaxID=66420 RepID=A0AAJ6ZZ42_PAPXU|nr:PREDICTED: rhomboid-related protein 2 [Papilio xuthus]
MAPHAHDCEEVERLNGEDFQEVPVHQGRRIQPEGPPAARAWVEQETERGSDSRTCSPGESRRLLGPAPPPLATKPRLQAGLTLGVWAVSKDSKKKSQEKKTKCQLANATKRTKTKFQKRKEKLIAVLKPPYFILTMIITIICVHVWSTEAVRAQLEWAPNAWRQAPWRLLTYGCVHATNAHLALNALVALAVGWRLEREQGWARAAGVWWGGVVAGALGAGTLQPHVRVVGASAAVYALLTAHLPNVCLRFGHVPLWWFRPLSVLVLGASEASWALLREPPTPATAATYSHVAWAAHVLGAAAGLPLGFLIFDGENSKERYMVCARVISLLVLAGGVAAAALHPALWHDHD